MYSTIHVYSTVYVTVHGTVHIDGLMTWHWSMMWHWLMMCHDPVGLKFLCIVDRWHGSISVDQKSRVQYTHYTGLFSTKPRHCSNYVVKPCYCSNRVVKPRGQTAYCWLMTWRNPKHPKYFWSNGHNLLNVSIKRGLSPSNWIALNPFLDSIFCNSFSILYFLRILINFHFTPSSIMSS